MRTLLALALAGVACTRDAPAPEPAGRARADPGRWVSCGDRLCDARKTYCEIIFKSEAPGVPSTHACQPLPLECAPDAGAPRTCDCFPAGVRCPSCIRIGLRGNVSGFQRTCVGGR